MEVYRTKDGQVSKFVHDDGSETAIKTVSSCANVYDKETGKIVPIDVEREKFSLFISSSVGCPVGCKFCYLTVKNFPYHKLTKNQIVENTIDALVEEVQHKPELRDKYLKLSWMGMGDAFILHPLDLVNGTQEMVGYLTENNYVKGLDGVDISTVFPTPMKRTGWPHYLGELNDSLMARFRRNPHSAQRSALRIFYSLHHKDLIPRRESEWADLNKLEEFSYWYGVDLITHHMFLEGINDSKADIDRIQVLIDRVCPGAELRILRYNECPNSPYKEAVNFDELVKYASEVLPKVKYQVSAGSEIKAACGQFLCIKNNDVGG